MLSRKETDELLAKIKKFAKAEYEAGLLLGSIGTPVEKRRAMEDTALKIFEEIVDYLEKNVIKEEPGLVRRTRKSVNHSL